MGGPDVNERRVCFRVSSRFSFLSRRVSSLPRSDPIIVTHWRHHFAHPLPQSIRRGRVYTTAGLCSGVRVNVEGLILSSMGVSLSGWSDLPWLVLASLVTSPSSSRPPPPVKLRHVALPGGPRFPSLESVMGRSYGFVRAQDWFLPLFCCPIDLCVQPPWLSSGVAARFGRPKSRLGLAKVCSMRAGSQLIYDSFLPFLAFLRPWLTSLASLSGPWLALSRPLPGSCLLPVKFRLRAWLGDPWYHYSERSLGAIVWLCSGASLASATICCRFILCIQPPWS